jgi:hypothetical protein
MKFNCIPGLNNYCHVTKAGETVYTAPDFGGKSIDSFISDNRILVPDGI